MTVSKTLQAAPMANIGGFKVAKLKNFDLSVSADFYHACYNEVLPKNKTAVEITTWLHGAQKAITASGRPSYFHQKATVCGKPYDKILRYTTGGTTEVFKPSFLRKLALKVPKKVMNFFNLNVPKVKWVKI